MAYYLKATGDAQPVFAIDVLDGPVDPTSDSSGTPVNLAGPKLDFFQVVASGSLAAEQGVNGYVSAVIQGVQQTSTVAMYQVDDTKISFGVFPTGAFEDAAAFLTAADVTFPGFTIASATGVGFKLAAS